jgi:hypothetical protein
MRDECEKLELELTETERLRFGADADRRQLRCDLSDAKAEASHYMAVAQKATDELIFFRADNLKAHQMTCAAALERDSLRAEVERLTPYVSKAILTHGGTMLCSPQVGVAFNEQQARAEKAEAELAEAKVERETMAQSSLRSLEAYIDKLKQFAERAEKAEADNAKWQKLLLMSRDDREIDLISEIEEQARLLGMSGEREADLLGKLGRLAKDKERLDWLAVSDTWFDYPATESFNPETFRDAIDAAMKGTP